MKHAPPNITAMSATAFTTATARAPFLHPSQRLTDWIQPSSEPAGASWICLAISSYPDDYSFARTICSDA
jgi:hypothetical protein